MKPKKDTELWELGHELAKAVALFISLALLIIIYALGLGID